MTPQVITPSILRTCGVQKKQGKKKYQASEPALAGGNQRELARQKNLKKTQEIHKGKRKEDSLSASQRKQRDSEIMQQKQKAANERKSMQTGAK